MWCSDRLMIYTSTYMKAHSTTHEVVSCGLIFYFLIQTLCLILSHSILTPAVMELFIIVALQFLMEVKSYSKLFMFINVMYNIKHIFKHFTSSCLQYSHLSSVLVKFTNLPWYLNVMKHESSILRTYNNILYIAYIFFTYSVLHKQNNYSKHEIVIQYMYNTQPYVNHFVSVSVSNYC